MQQKKGDPSHLDGRVTVYAIINIDPSDLVNMKHPVASMIHNGFLVAQGNFKEQSNLRDFLKSEMGISLDEGLGEGLAQLLDKIDGLESALDPQKLKDRLENMDELSDFIPTPAKIVPFHSLEEILEQEGDVYCTGIFQNIGNAVLSVNALPILYQARYREQDSQRIRNEIEQLISQIERNEPLTKSQIPQPQQPPQSNIEEKILKEFIPNMLYCRKEPSVFAVAEKQFRDFMSEYKFGEDTEAVISIIGKNEDLSARDFKLLELYAKKISSVYKEDFANVESLRKEIQKLYEQPLL